MELSDYSMNPNLVKTNEAELEDLYTSSFEIISHLQDSIVPVRNSNQNLIIDTYATVALHTQQL